MDLEQAEKHCIVKMYHGSKLYGLDTPESDTDIKGIFFIEADDVLLGQTKCNLNSNKGNKTKKNTSEDIEVSWYSYHTFLNMAREGQMIALDMLHAPKSAILRSSPIWDVLVKERSMFYSKDMSPYLSYLYKQAEKYGIKGSKINSIESVIKVLEKYPNEKLSDVVGFLPELPHVKVVEQHAKMFLQVIDKKYQFTLYNKEIIVLLKLLLTTFGNRAREAALNQNVDWKAVSHAFRTGYQLRHIVDDGGFTYPLPESEFIMKVKTGQLDFKSVVEPALQDLFEEVSNKLRNSSLPDTVDTKYIDLLIRSHHVGLVFGAYPTLNSILKGL